VVLPPTRRLPPMPPEIAKAIVAVNKQVKSLGKDANNPHGKYKYTSVDAFYEAIGPMMADAGLIAFTNEIETAITQRESTDDYGHTKRSNWLTSQYEIMLYHESGVEWGPIRRAMMVIASGPQAYGSGQSYVEKYFLRGLFKVPTGDGDADSHERAELPARQQRPSRPPLRQPAPPHHPDTGEILGPHRIPMPEDGNWITWGATFVAAIKASKDRAEFEQWLRECGPEISALKRQPNPKTFSLLQQRIAEQEARFPAPNGAATVNEADLLTPEDITGLDAGE